MNDLALLEQRFISLLDQQCTEQVYQSFIEENTVLVPREFVQNHGVHFDLVFRKLPLGSDYTTDFCYLSKSSADWHCVLIEIEKPQSRYFRTASTSPHADFLAALDQINQWRAWFSNPSNLDGFVSGTLGTLRGTMRQNPCAIKYVLVHGRRAEFHSDDHRLGYIRGLERDDFRILSYDSLVESLHSKSPLYVGVKKNDHIEILSNTFISEVLFTLMPPSCLRITDELRKSILAHRESWRYYTTSHQLVLDNTLPQIGIVRGNVIS